MKWLLAVWLLPIVQISASAQQGNVEALLLQGEGYAAEGKLIQAREAYEKAIASGAAVEKDAERSYKLGLWYKNAEPHDFGKAAQWFESALNIKPDDEIRLHLAQAFSWNGQYSSAIEQYRQLVRNKPADAELKRQLARVLSWAKQYPESLALYDQIQTEVPDDVELLIERARVISWSGRYSQASQAYAEVLKQVPGNRDARLGQAQVLYWSGHLNAALKIARELLKEDPQNANASFLMAAMEHNRGQDESALRWLQNAAPDKDTKELRDGILRNRRPVLHFKFGFENDREEPTSGPDSTYRTLRYTSEIMFRIANGVKMEVTHSTTQNDTSTEVLRQLGRDSLTFQTAAHLHFTVNPWLQLSAGAGEGNTDVGNYQGIGTDRRHHLIYDVRAVFSHPGLRMDLSSVRRICDYTPLAVHLDLMQRRETISAAYMPGKRIRIGGEYWYATYTGEARAFVPEHFKMHAQGGSVIFSPILYSSERIAFEAGVRYDLFRFQDGTAATLDPMRGLGSTGIFTPRLYQRYAGTASIRWSPQKWIRMELEGNYGPQRIFGFASLNPPPAEFGETGNFGIRVTTPIARFAPYITYDYFTTNTPASPGIEQGAFSSYLMSSGLRIRF